MKIYRRRTMKNGKGLQTFGTGEYIDLGDWSRTCYTHPAKCDSGFTLSAYVKVVCQGGFRGYISTVSGNHPTKYGHAFLCYNSILRYDWYVNNTRYFYKVANNAPADSTSWLHLVVEYSVTSGLAMYFDQVLTYPGPETFPMETGSSGIGRIVIGRFYTDKDKMYGAVTVDSLTVWDRVLTAYERSLL